MTVPSPCPCPAFKMDVYNLSFWQRLMIQSGTSTRHSAQWWSPSHDALVLRGHSCGGWVLVDAARYTTGQIRLYNLEDPITNMAMRL